jgi:hypothetical protein
MLTVIGYFFALVFGLVVIAALCIPTCYKLFGPDPPPGVKALISLCLGILHAAIRLIDGPPSVIRRTFGTEYIRLPKDNTDTPQLPIDDVKKITTV